MTKGHLFVLLFFVLLTANVWNSHRIGSRSLDRATIYRAQVESERTVDAEEIGREAAFDGIQLFFFNIPLLVVLGVEARAEVPGQGLLYWLAVLLGSLYAPLIAALMLFFLVHPPQERGMLPGVEWDDGSLKDETEDDD